MSITLADANIYLAANSLNTTAWDAATDAIKQKALAQAENEILSLPWRTGSPYQANAVYEQAAFDLEITQTRANLQAQGVTAAGISGGASETYKPTRYGFPLAPGAQKWIRGWVMSSVPTR